MLRECSISAVSKYLRLSWDEADHIEEGALSKITCASMDMWQPYINAVESHVPGGMRTITHDPFHVIKKLNEAVDKDWYRDAMRSKLDPVKAVARMIHKRRDQVLNFFIHRVTNACSEGINSTIQALIKRANGYRKRERLKRDLLFHMGGLDLYPAINQ